MIRISYPAINVVLAICLGVLLTACGGGSKSAVDISDTSQSAADNSLGAQPFSGAFPTPGALPRTASVPSEGDRIRYASSWDPSLPNSRVVNGFVGAELTSVFEPGFNTEFSTLAYVGLRFVNLDGYSGDSGLRVHFSTPPQDYGTVFLGVSDFANDSWRWFSIPEDEYIPMPGLSNYISPDGQLYAVVLLMADDTCELEWIIVGDRLQVAAALSTDLNIDPTQNLAPLLVTFYGSSSSVIGGEIVSYDFDWDDDGTFEVTEDEDGEVQHTYNTPGIYTARMRVYDDLGNSDDDTVEFTVIDPGNTPPVADLQSDVLVGLAPQEINLDASGSTDDKGIVKYEWDLDGDGEYELDTGDEPAVNFILGLAGITNVGVRVTDQDFASDSTSVGISIPNGFNTSVIDNSNTTSWNISAAICGESPNEFVAVAYGTSADNDLMVARSDNLFANAWQGPYLAAPEEDFGGLYPSIMKAQFGNPAVVFAKSNQGEFTLQSVFATDHNCDDWFPPTSIDTFDEFYFWCTASLVDDTIMAVVSTGGQTGTGSSVYAYRSLNGSATTWSDESLIYHEPSSAGIYGLDLGTRLVDSVEWPVLSIARAFFGETDAGVALIASSDHDGTIWGGPTWYNGFKSTKTSQAFVNTRPAVLSTASDGSSGANYARSTSADGTTWPTEMTNLSDLGEACYADLAVVSGKPAICYRDYSTGKLMYVTAVDADGAAWNEPFVAASGLNTGRNCTMVVRAGIAPVILYINDTTGSIDCASWI